MDLPAVGPGGEDAVFQGLRGHPPDRQQTLPTFAVIIRLIDISGHAEVWTKTKKKHYILLHVHLLI